jgi:RNA polymerase sigma-54 factor
MAENMGPKLEIRQKLEQRLKLLPQLWQSLHLLQLPVMQLKEYLEQEFEKNPLLELDEKEKSLSEEEEIEQPEEEPWWIRSKEKISPDEEKKRQYLETLITKAETLQEHLLKQLHFQKLNNKELKIGEELIGNIDEDGYLKIDIEEISKKFKAKKEKIEKVLDLIQTFDPPGVGARDLAECLKIQLKIKGIDNETLNLILDNFLPELGRRDFHSILKKLKIREERLENFLKFLKTLEPKPGRNYSQSKTWYAIPEVFIDEDDNGEYKIKVNEEEIPKIRINKYYINLLKNPNTSDETKKYIRNKIKQAKELIQAFQQRNKTILKITQFIIEKQKGFLKKGKSYLNPLKLKDVAQAIGLDESTVSRAVHGKYVDTPIGIFELKEFFSTEIGGVSTDKVKQRIIELIESEDPKNPLTDKKIADILSNEGIEIARRTILKYREELKILPSKLRKK